MNQRAQETAGRNVCESQAVCRMLYDKSPFEIALTTLDGVFVDMNERFVRAGGIPREQLIGKTALELGRVDVGESRRLNEALELAGGALEHFESTLTKPDGTIRRVQVSVHTIDFLGKPHLLCLYDDLTEKKRTEDAINSIVVGVSGAVGERFFESAVTQFAKILEADHTLIGEIVEQDGDRFVRTIAYYADNRVQPNFEYRLKGSPCEQVAAGRICSYPDGVAHLFPEDLGLQRRHIVGYVGIGLYDSEKKPTGVMAAMYDRPIANVAFAESILRIFAARAESEIDRMRAETALRAGEERHRLAWETCPDFFTISRLEDGVVIDANKGFTALTGCSHEEAIGKSAVELNIWNDMNDRTALISQLKREGHVRDWETRFRVKCGDIRRVLVSAALLTLRGEPHMLAMVKDIEKFRQAEEARHKSDAMYKELFDNSADIVFIGDLRGRCTSVNPAVEEILGYSQKEMMTIIPLDIVDSSYRSIVADSLRTAIKRATATSHCYEVVANAKDGRSVWLELNARLFYEDRIPAGVHVIARDITDRKRAEHLARVHTEELEAINRLARSVSMSLSLDEISAVGLRDIVSVLEADHAMLFLRQDDELVLQASVSGAEHASRPVFPVHKIGECLCGLAVREGIPVFSSNIHDDPRCTWPECRNAGLKSLAAVPLVVAGEVVGVMGVGSYRERDFASRKDFIQSLGHELSMGVNNSRLFEQVHQHAADLESKFEELKQANQTREMLWNQLLQSQKMEAIGRLAGGIAHDFNNLLSVMMGYSSMLKDHFPKGSPQAERLFQIETAADRAASLTRQLLAFSRKQVLELRVVDLNLVVRDVEKMLSRLVGEDIELREVITAAPARVKADRDQIAQILVNLAVNARDAMPRGGKLTIETANVVLDAAYARNHDGVKPGPYVMFVVSDDGVGMDAETQARIFEPFFTTKGKGLGTGLGLSTVFGIIKQHEGHVTVYSESGRGSTFKVFLPQVDDRETEEPDIESSALQTSGGETILVVEDENMVRDYACEALEVLGYVTLSAQNPEEAIEVSDAHEGAIDLLLTDVVLPDMDGKTLFNKLHPKRPEMRVIYMSGYTDDAIVHHGVLESGVHFLQKPFSINKLGKKISEVFWGSERTSEAGDQPGDVEPVEMDEVQVLTLVRRIPMDLAVDLSRAAQEADRKKTLELIRRLAESEPLLASAFEQWLKHFRFDRIIGSLESRVPPA